MKRPVEIIEKHLGRFAINLCEAVDHLSLTEAVCKIIEKHHVIRQYYINFYPVTSHYVIITYRCIFIITVCYHVISVLLLYCCIIIT